MSRRRRRQHKGKASDDATYTETDYHSGDGMLTTVWGPAMWHVLHTFSFNYPVHPTETQKRQYRDYMTSLRHVLPCKYCRDNLKKNMQKLPLTRANLASRDAFSRYVYDLHELVNNMLHKESKLSYDEVRERYEHFRARCTQGAAAMSRRTMRGGRHRRRRTQKELGCTEPLVGAKAKCLLRIVPQSQRSTTFRVNKCCIKRRCTLRTFGDFAERPQGVK